MMAAGFAQSTAPLEGWAGDGSKQRGGSSLPGSQRTPVPSPFSAFSQLLKQFALSPLQLSYEGLGYIPPANPSFNSVQLQQVLIDL